MSEKSNEVLQSPLLANAINILCEEAHANAKSKGWWDESPEVKIIRDVADAAYLSEDDRTALLNAVESLAKPNLGEKISLMHSELSEALEWERKQPGAPSDHIPGFTGLEEEFADVLIRIFDTSAQRKLRLGEAVLAKMAFNSNRPHKHGGKKF